MIDARRRRRLVTTTAIALLALAAAPSARATCLPFLPNTDHLFALAGETCTASGTYNPTTPIPGTPPTPIVGLYAADGSVINASSAITVNANAADSIAVYASGVASAPDPSPPSTISISPSILVEGARSNGVQADNGGIVRLTGGSVMLGAGVTGAEGLFATGPGSQISTSGTSIGTNGPDTPAVLSASSANVILVGGSVTTNGEGSAALFGEFGSVSATGTTIKTTGSVDAFDNQSIAVWIAGTGETATLTNDTIMTSGVQSEGVQASSGGHATISGGSITIAATATDANGVLAFGSGSVISIMNGTTITSDATPLSSVIAGAQVENSATLNMINTTVMTSGSGTSGVDAEGGGTANLQGGVTVSTTGSDARALVASGTGSTAMLTGANVFTTTGDGSIGLSAAGGGIIDATGPTAITTGSSSASTGLNAYGVNADGASSQVNLAATTVTTYWTNAYGLYASNGGTIDAPDSPSVTTSGTGAIGVFASGASPTSGAASTITIGDALITTNGAMAAGAEAAGGGVLTVNGGSVTTKGGDAPAIVASGVGSKATLSGTSVLSTIGNGSIGLYALGGGVINALGQTTITTSGTTSTSTGLGAYGLLAATGGAILVQGPTSVTVSGALSSGVQAASGMVTASAALNVTTLQASSAAFALSGTSPSIIASGGGTVSAAGNAINFINAASAVATFDNFNITSSSGDLIFAEPSMATVNFNNTVANASGGNLLNATLGSVVALNANASTLTGAIQTDATSTTNVSLANGTTWTMTGSSTMTNLNVTNSAIVFSSSGGFKTLTVGSLVGGTGANVTLNTALGGTPQITDQIVINGGSATGTTSLTIKNASGSAGAPTTGAGIPVVVVTNGGTTSTTAFQLLNNVPVVAGGFEYTLGRGGNEDWYLTSSPTASLDELRSSVTTLAQSQLNNMVTSRLLGSLLLGANEQINSCSCGGGFASVGSFALGSHGRWSLNDNVTLLAGASFDQYYEDGTNVRAAPIVAASLRYDPGNWGSSRPFLEFGAALSPYIATTYTRYYTNGFTPATGVGSAVDRGLSVFGRVGWVARFTPIDEGAVFTDLVRGWQQSGGYTEAASANNPFPTTVSTGLDREDIVRVGAQYTHLLWGNLEANINGAVAYGFDNKFGSQINVVDFGSVAPFPLLNSAWTEFGGRLAYRFSRNLVADAFVLGTLGGEIGPTLHVGLGVRYAF